MQRAAPANRRSAAQPALRSSSNGGALGTRVSDTLVVDTRFVGNSAVNGGAIYLWNDSGAAQQYTLINIEVVGNKASNQGGGVYSKRNDELWVNALITGNSAATEGGAICSDNTTTLRLVNSTLFNNLAPVGSELQSIGTSAVEVLNSIVWNTTPYASGSIAFALDSEPVFASSVVVGSGGSGSWNSATGSDGGRNLDVDPDCVSAPQLTHATLAGSTTASVETMDAELYFAIGDRIAVGNDSTLREAIGREVTSVSGTTVSFTPAMAAPAAANVRVDLWGTGVSAATLDLSLQATSICIDAGDNGALPADSWDFDSDADTTEKLPIDLLGNPRFWDATAVVDTGSGLAPIADIGAYESQE